MTTRKKKTAVSEAAVMEAIREALEGLIHALPG